MPAALVDMPLAESSIVAMTNEARRGHGAGALAVDAHLAAAARAFATYLATTGRFAHDADGRTPAARSAAAGYAACATAENIAAFQRRDGYAADGLAAATVTGWLASPPHRANLFEPSLTEVGVGVARSDGAVPRYVAVQLFGRPAKLFQRVTIANHATVAATYTIGGVEHHLPPGSETRETGCRPRPLAVDGVAGAFVPGAGETVIIVRAADGRWSFERRPAKAQQRPAAVTPSR